MEFSDIAAKLTINDALKYHATDEKFTYCIDILDMSAHQPNAEYMVERLETHFESMVELHAIMNKVEIHGWQSLAQVHYAAALKETIGA